MNTNFHRLTDRITFIFLCGLLLIAGQTGCSTLSSLSDVSVPPVAGAPTETYRVEMGGGFYKSNTYTGTIDGPITVQTALERAGAIDKFRNMEIMILRIVSENGRGLKMPIRYTPRKKSVSPEQDYAILPGDRIIIKPMTHTPLDKVIDSLGGGK